MSQAGRFSVGSPSGVPIETLTGNTGGPVGPDGAFNINIVGEGSGVTSEIVVTGDPGTNTLTISPGSLIATIYEGDLGAGAEPIFNVMTIIGGNWGVTNPFTNITTTADVNTMEIRLNNSIYLPNTNASGTEGVLYANGDTFLHNYGTNNTFLGRMAGNLTLDVPTATTNTGVGQSALAGLTFGDANVGIGNAALLSTTSGDNNTIVGTNGMFTVTTGRINDCFGSNVGTNGFTGVTTGSFNILIGGSDAASVDAAGEFFISDESSNIIIGHNPAVAGDDNTIRIGSIASGTGDGEQNRCFIAGIQGVNPAGASSGLVIIDSSGQLGSLAVASDGQLPIGSTGADPVLATLTAGTGISITNGAGSITIDSTVTALSWSEVTGTTQALAVNTGYIMNNGTGVTGTLPSTAALGSIIRIVGKGVGLTVIAQNSGQTIYFENQTTTTGVTGSLTATNQHDTLELVCITADTDFAVLSSLGFWTVA